MPERQPEAGQDRARAGAAALRGGGRRSLSRPRLVDLVEHAAVGEVRRLRLAPAAEVSSMVTSLHLREAARRTCAATAGVARPVVVLGDDLLAIRL